MYKKLLALPFALALLALFVFAAPAYASHLACHATGGADCDGWWVNLVGPGEGWVLDTTVGATSGDWQPGETHVDYDVTATWKKRIVSGNWDYVSRPITPPVYDCEFVVNIHGTNRDVSEFYDKPTGDSHHCHRIVWGNLSPSVQNAFKAMHDNDYNHGSPNHGSWQSAYNGHIDQNPNAHLVTPGGYGSCPAGYAVDPGNQARCRKWVDTSHWIYETHRFTGTILRPDCYEACDVTVAQTPTTEWGDWSPWVYNSELALETSFKDGVETTVYLDSRDAQLVCDTATLPVHEERTREVDYPNGALVPSQTCEPAPGSWVYEVIVPEGASAELISGALSGPWLNLYAPEDNAASVPTAVFTWDSGYSEQVVGEVIDKHLECLHCRVTELYSMRLYTDPNAPAVYWEGPFGFPACPIIHLDGEVPAAFRVTQNCSICPQSGLEGGYIFHGVPVADGEGRVLRYDCYGHEPRYFYLEQDWDDLVRFDFDADGTRRSCRVDGCVDWINENAGLTP
jgi:hypothetical protein